MMRAVSNTEASPFSGQVKRDWWVLALAAGVFVALSRYFGAGSEGFLEADAAVHYMYARHAFSEPHYFVDIWGRPIKTILYCVPAWLGGRAGVQWASVGLAVGSAWMCYLLAWRLKVARPAVAFVAMLGQPLIFLHSFSELTELPFVFVLCLCLWAYARRTYWLAALLVGLLPAARPEGFGLVVVMAGALMLHRRWWAVPLCFLGVAVWSYVGWELYGRNPVGGPHLWLKTYWPYAAQSAYHSGSIFHFAALLPAVTGPLLFPAVVVGLGTSLRGVRRIGGLDHADRCRVLFAGLAVGVLVGHSVLFYLGKMASNGEPRYMMVAAPMWALACAVGVDLLVGRFGVRWPVGVVCVAAALPLAVNYRVSLGPVTWGYPVLPLVQTADWLEARALMRELETRGHYGSQRRLMAAHPAVYYFAELSRFDDRAPDFSQAEVARRPKGTLAIWDPMYAWKNADTRRIVTPEEFLAAGWTEVPTAMGPRWRVFMSEAPGAPGTRGFPSP
jgi:hypothetical protein